ncbi:MAG: T9SS type A sorting domain-containing protein [Saprospiraceae bacterium]
MIKNFTKLFLLAFTFLLCVSINAQIFSEDFEGGLPTDWTASQMDGSTVNASSNWIYTTSGPQGGFSIGPLTSTTANNGYMIFDSDLNCDGPQDVWLISPSFDATDFDDVVVTFEHFYARFNDQIFLEVSIDGGTVWEEYELYEELGNNDFAGAGANENPVLSTTVISNIAANQSDVIIAFRFFSSEGCAYSWQIDDIVVTDVDPTPFFDMRLNTNFFAIPPSINTPASQVDPIGIGFLCDVENVGQMDAGGVNLNINISTTTGGVLHNQDLDYGTVPAGAIDENRIFPDRYTPPGDANVVYDAVYTISMDSTDLVPANNEIAFQFAVSDSVFAKEFNITTAGGPPDPAVTPWTLANHYYLPNGDDYVCSSIVFSIGNATESVGGLVNVYLYEWEDINDDGIAQSGERDGTIGGEIVANGIYTIQAADTDVQLVLENWNASPDYQIRLKDDTHYLLSVETTPPAGATEYVSIAGTGVWDYTAMSFLNDSLNTERYGSFWNVNEVGTNADLTQVIFAPRIRMHITPEQIIIIDAVDNQLSEDNIVNIFPNPVREELNLELDFVASFDEVIIKITDMTGKEIHVRNLNNIDQQIAQINTSNYVQGTYTLQVITPNGVRTKRFVVAK